MPLGINELHLQTRYHCRIRGLQLVKQLAISSTDWVLGSGRSRDCGGLPSHGSDCHAVMLPYRSTNIMSQLYDCQAIVSGTSDRKIWNTISDLFMAWEPL
jgi:hypothetical protein